MLIYKLINAILSCNKTLQLMKTNKESREVLEQIGMSKEEALIYKALLKMGPSSISEIIRQTKLHRPTVYKAIPSLTDLGLLSMMPKGKYKLYVAKSPEKLEKLFEDLEDDFNSEIFELHEVYKMRNKRPIVTYNEGDKAIKDVFSDVVHSLPKNSVYYRYSSGLTLSRKKYVPADYRIVRDRKSLERLIITDSSSKKAEHLKLGRSVKAVPCNYGLFDLDITQIIYGNKVVLIDYGSKTTILIENEMIAEFQKKIFKLLYSKL